MFKVGPFHSLRNVSAIVYSPCGINIYQSPKAICFGYKITDTSWILTSLIGVP